MVGVVVLVVPVRAVLEHEKTPLVGEGSAINTSSALELALCADTHVRFVVPYTG